MTLPDDPSGSVPPKSQRLVVDFGDEATELDESGPQPASSPSNSPLMPSPELASPLVAPPVPRLPGCNSAAGCHHTGGGHSTPLVPSGAICRGCGASLKVTDQFCTRCGTASAGPSTAAGGPSQAGFVPPPMNAGAPCREMWTGIGAWPGTVPPVRVPRGRSDGADGL